MRSSAETTAGDLLLVRGAAGRDAPERVPGGWRRLAEHGGWRLLAHPGGAGWRPLPLAEVTVGDRRGWLLGEPRGPDPEAWTRVAVRDGDARDLNGQFLLWTWDGGRGEWSVRTDRFGTLHAYHAARGGTAAVGTFHPAVAALASAGTLDWVGLAGFFGTGYFPGDRTHFEDVRILRPARRYRFASGSGARSERYWRWWHAPSGDSFERAVDDFAETLAAVVADHCRGRVALPLSGGLDSRCLAAVVGAEGPSGADRDVWAFSYGYGSRSVETRIARRVAAARALPFDEFVVPSYLFDRIDLALACTEGFQDLFQTRQLGIADEIAARADAVLGGHWGDVWLDTLGLEGETAVTRERVVRHLLARTWKPAGWLDEHLCRPALGADPRDARRAMVESELAEYDDVDDPDFRIKAFKTDQWSFRWTLASVRAYRPAAVPRLPFYDTRLTDLFARMPSGFQRGRRLQTEYLRRHAPDLARIRWQDRDADLFGGRLADVRAGVRRAARKVRRAISGERVIQRNWEVQIGAAGGWRALEERLLSPGAAIHDHVEPSAVRALLESLRAGPDDGALGYQVSMLLTFGAWLEASR